MPLLSQYARKQKLSYFTRELPKNARILEVGCGDGWFGVQLKSAGYKNYVGLDLKGPADIVGNILECFQEFFDLLKPGGLLMLTSPVPHMDWACKLLERFGLNQKRTSPHDHLLYFRNVRMFEPLEIKIIGGMAQWGRFLKPASC
ncbi:MAG: hypothetical protein DMG85_09365 [Acidobacteria bacterium]|nr:MAG: hypothetical protein DMG85_09365 [Acidobacteriota bacterium]